MAQQDTRQAGGRSCHDMGGLQPPDGCDEARMLRVLAVPTNSSNMSSPSITATFIKRWRAFLADFPSVVNAVAVAQRIQDQFRIYNSEKDKASRSTSAWHSLGDIIQQNGDVLGDGVNIASRLQTLAEPDTICISHAVYQEVEKKSLGRVGAWRVTSALW